MADIDPITARAVFTQFALSTTGIDPAWDKALHAYLRAEALARADAKFGQQATVYEGHARLRLELQHKHGRDWSSYPAAAEQWTEMSAMTRAADEEWIRRYCEPNWRAGRELAATPAPSMPAALFKAALIDQEEVWNDSDFPLDAMQVLHDDFARLAGEQDMGLHHFPGAAPMPASDLNH